MADQTADRTTRMDSPAANAAAVDLSSTDATIAPPSRGIYVSGAGDVKVDLVGGQTGITFAAVPAGSILPVQVSKIYKTGSTATSMVVLW